MRTHQDIERIITEVRSRLSEKQRATGIDLNVPNDGFFDGDGWLSIIVSPASGNVRTYDYVETLSEVEADLRNAGEQNVVLVPAMA